MRSKTLLRSLLRSLLPVLALLLLGGTSSAAGSDGLGTARVPNEGIALLLSASATVVPIVAGNIISRNGGSDGANTILVASGIFLGPAAGYFYGGCTRRGGAGIAIRLVTAGATVGAVALVMRSGGEGFFDKPLGGAVAVAVVGTCLLLAEDVYDICAVPEAVRERGGSKSRRNEGSALQPSGGSLGLAPVFLPDRRALGLGLEYRFGPG